MSIETTWFDEDCPEPALLPHGVSALEVARWYAHGLATFLPAPLYCERLRAYLAVWRLPVPERWCFVPVSIEEGAMLCYRSAIREALERGHGSASSHDIAAVLEEWAAAPPFDHPQLDGDNARLLVDRTLELVRYTADQQLERIQYRVIGRRAHYRHLQPTPTSLREPEWRVYDWDGGTADLLGAYFFHQNAQIEHKIG